MARCPCHSGKTSRRCCDPLHAGKPASSPQALMRSRFSAYARGLAAYIVQTTDPSGPQWREDRAAWEAEIQRFCQAMDFVGLAILDAPPPHDHAAFVTFRATLRQGDRDASFSERSRFTRHGAGWRYHSGEALAD